MARSLGFARVILLTGATGLLGSAVLRRLVARGEPVRCLVRDARRLGPERMHVQLASGDLADPGSFRNALRGVRTVVHLAGAARDQPGATLEELDGLAAYRLVGGAPPRSWPGWPPPGCCGPPSARASATSRGRSRCARRHTIRAASTAPRRWP